MNKDQYVNPKYCAHAYVTTRQMPGSQYVYARCQVCNLQGEPVQVGWLNWLARSRAVRKFYQLANRVDKEKQP